MLRHEMNANNVVKWRWFIVPKIEQINDKLFIDNKSNKIKLAWMKQGKSRPWVNDSKMSMRWMKQRSLVNTVENSPDIA